MRILLSLSFLFLVCVTKVFAQSDTLAALRSDLDTGQLANVFARYPSAFLSPDLREQLIAQQDISRYAVTGYNENSTRFAARVRVHFVKGGVGFFALYGQHNDSGYVLRDWTDYGSGLSRDDVLALARWGTTREGGAFLTRLSDNPSDPQLAVQLQRLATSRDATSQTRGLAAHHLWLAQCVGQPCAALAQSAFTANMSPAPAVWSLSLAAEEGSQTHWNRALETLTQVLGDDPYLWWLSGQSLLQFAQCDWGKPALREAWLRHKTVQPLLDVHLQCTLALWSDQASDHQALNELQTSLGADALHAAVKRYYQKHERPMPSSLTKALRQ